MSPTTLYREGTDLDELLAELDTRFPGQVRVVEVTRPREGGVLGFFAKERVGVHYRLVDPAVGMPGGSAVGAGSDDVTAAHAVGGSSAGFGDAGAGRPQAVSSRARRPHPEQVAAAAFDGGITRLPGNDEIRVAGSAGPARAAAAGSAVARDGFGPDSATLRAALAARLEAADARGAAPQAAAARDTDSRDLAVTSPHLPAATLAGDVGADLSADVSRVAPAAGMEFSQILADIALRKASAASRFSAPVARAAASLAAEPPQTTFVPLDIASELATVSAAAAPASTPMTVADRLFDPAAAAVESAPPATSTAGTTSPRRTPRAVPKFTAPAALLDDGPAVQPAFNALPHFSADGVAVPSPGSAVADTPTPSTVLASASPAAAGNDLSDAAPPRPGSLSWPLAASTAALPSTRQAADSARLPGNATALLSRLDEIAAAGEASVNGEASSAETHSRETNSRETGAAQARAASDPTPGGRTDETGDPLREASYVVGGENTSGQSAPLTLRRQMLELGVPVDRVPTDAVHAYAAVETLVRGLDPAPRPPSGAGQILVVAGAARDVVQAADSIIADNPGVFETVWSFGCPAALGTPRVQTTGNVIASPRQAEIVAAAARQADTGPTIIVIATDTVAHNAATDIVAAIAADSVWAAVDATRKPADTRCAMRTLGKADAIIVANAEHSASPATVWELGLPIALVDGRPSTAPTWAVLLLGKLSELEESACSTALY